MGALDGHDVEWIKVADTKGCLTFDTACHSQGCSSSYVFCIALKRQVALYKLSVIIIFFNINNISSMYNQYVMNNISLKTNTIYFFVLLFTLFKL